MPSAPPIVYISYLTPLSSNLPAKLPSTSIFPSPSDISIYKLIQLPFSFNYFGQLYEYIYITSKCAVTINPAPFCFYGSNCFRSFTSLQYFSITGIPNGLISAYFADFKYGNISYTLSTDHVAIHYANMTLSNSSSTNSFEIIIHTSGKISLNYIQITSKYQTSSGVNTPLSGIVQPLAGYNVMLTPSQQASSQQYLNKFSSFPNLITGVFPSFSSIASETSFNLCPISSLWELGPSSFYLNSSMNTTLSALSFACVADVDIHLVSADQSNYSNCSIIDGVNSSSPTFAKYICDVSLFIASYGDVYLNIGWTLKNSPTKPHLLNVASLKISVLMPSNQTSNSTFSKEVSCAFNGNSNQCGCDISASNSTCLQLPCFSILHSASINNLYAVPADPSCGNTCASNVFTDIHGICCGLESLDCSGVCNGSARPALSLEGDLTCCQSAFSFLYTLCNHLTSS